jgi:peptide deformylase
MIIAQHLEKTILFCYSVSMCTIVQEPHPTLRAQALPVNLETISSPKLALIISDMQKVLHREPDGVALAAPQIGVSLRIFIVAGFVFDLNKKNITGTKSLDKIFINPEIIKKSKETKWIPGEGCLSVRWKYGTAKRHKQVTVHAYDETGKEFLFPCSGLLAQIMQHEIDHLNGILFIDHAKDIRLMDDQEIAEYQEELDKIAQERA